MFEKKYFSQDGIYGTKGSIHVNVCDAKKGALVSLAPI